MHLESAVLSRLGRLSVNLDDSQHENLTANSQPNHASAGKLLIRL